MGQILKFSFSFTCIEIINSDIGNEMMYHTPAIPTNHYHTEAADFGHHENRIEIRGLCIYPLWVVTVIHIKYTSSVTILRVMSSEGHFILANLFSWALRLMLTPTSKCWTRWLSPESSEVAVLKSVHSHMVQVFQVCLAENIPPGCRQVGN